MIDKYKAWGRDGLMVIAATRYCLGRMTYIVSDCVDWLIDVWPELDEHVKAIIIRDVKEKIRLDDMHKVTHSDSKDYGPLGMSMDRREWERLMKTIDSEATLEKTECQHRDR